MGNWIRYSFDEIIEDISDGGTPPRSKEGYFGGEIPWVVIDDIQDNIYDTAEKLTKEGLQACSSKLWPNGTIILSTGATIGEVGIAQVDVATKQGVCGIKINESLIDNVFFMYYLKFIKNHLLSLAQGSTIKEIRPNVIRKFSLFAPKSIEEQHKIGSLLTKFDGLIIQTQQSINKFNKLKTGMMQDLLTNGIDERGNIRSKETHEYKDSPIGRVPVEWDVEKLECHLEDIEQGWSPQCDFEPASIGEWGVLKTTAVTWDGYNEYENKRLPSDLSPKVQYEVKKDDVLMTRGGPNSRVGVVCHVENKRENLILSDKLYRLIPKDHIKPKYLALVLSSEATQRHLSTMKTGMAESQTNISQEIVKNLFIKIIDVNEQDRIINKLNLVQENINGLNIELAKLKRIKVGLMQDLLTGKVSVADLSFEEVSLK